MSALVDMRSKWAGVYVLGKCLLWIGSLGRHNRRAAQVCIYRLCALLRAAGYDVH